MLKGVVCIRIITAGGVRYFGNPYDVVPAIFKDALNKHNIDFSVISPKRIGLFLSYTDSNLWAYHEFYKYFKHTKFRWGSSNIFPYTPSNSLASFTAIKTGIQGINMHMYEKYFCFNAIEAAGVFLEENQLEAALVGWEGSLENNEYLYPADRIFVYGILASPHSFNGAILKIHKSSGDLYALGELNRNEFFSYTELKKQMVIFTN